MTARTPPNPLLARVSRGGSIQACGLTPPCCGAQHHGATRTQEAAARPARTPQCTARAATPALAPRAGPAGRVRGRGQARCRSPQSQRACPRLQAVAEGTPPHRAAPGSFASVRHARPFGSNMWRHCRRSNPETAAVAKHNMSFSRSSLKMAVEGAGNQGSALSPACNAAGSHLATRAAGGGGLAPHARRQQVPAFGPNPGPTAGAHTQDTCEPVPVCAAP